MKNARAHPSTEKMMENRDEPILTGAGEEKETTATCIIESRAVCSFDVGSSYSFGIMSMRTHRHANWPVDIIRNDNDNDDDDDDDDDAAILSRNPKSLFF
jgi:hypothetical protein